MNDLGAKAKTFSADDLKNFAEGWGMEQLVINIGIFIHDKHLVLELMEFFHELRQNESEDYQEEIQEHRSKNWVSRNQKHETGIREIMQKHQLISSS